MKHYIQLLVFASLTGLCTLPALAMPPIVLGSNVSIPQLNPSNVGTYFTVFGGVIIEDFTVSGDLEIYDLDNKSFNDVEISGADNLTFTLTNGLIFRSCNIHHSGSITLDDSQITFTGSSIHDCDEIILNSESRIDVNGVSNFTDFLNGIFVFDKGVLNAHTTTFDHSPIVATGEISVILQDCELLNNDDPAGVFLTGGGYYYGRNNIFHDNLYGIWGLAESTDFTHIEEHDSDFYNNSWFAIGLENISEVRLINNDINTNASGKVAVKINLGNGITDIADNNIVGSNGATRGLLITARTKASITNNSIEGFGIAGMFLGQIDNLTVEDNNLYDNIGANYGIHMTGCSDAQVISNNVTEHRINISLLFSDNATLESNICSYATSSNIYVSRSQGVTLCSNLCNHGEDGITFESTGIMLEMNDNAMTYCERGLVYKQDVLTNAQIDKGNYFLLNTLGAEFEDVTDLGAINAMRYEVRNLSTEYPTFTPSGWFLPIATTALDCTPIGPVPPIGIKPDVERLIEGVNDLTPDGKITNDFMIALELIGSEPDFLDDEDIDDFYNTYGGTDLDLLPTIQNISALRESFPESTPAIIIDDEGFLDADLSDHYDYLDLMKEDYEDLVSDEKTKLLNAITDVEELDPVNIFEENYQFAILKYLGHLVGEELTTQDDDDIIDLAEGCVADDGPGVYVAQIVADIEELSYTKATSCTPVTPRTDKSAMNPNEPNHIKVSPNPANDHLKLSTYLKDESINIYDIVGHLSFHNGNFTGNRIDISTLMPGIYFFQIEDSNERRQFVKL